MALVAVAASAARAQSNTRLLLSSGWGVPEHSGFVFGPFSNLALNDAKEIVFLSSLRGAKRDMRAVVRSSGVTFSVVAFEGLRSPVPRATYESFGAPSLNNAGIMAFTATLKNDVPASAVIRVEEGLAQAVAISGSSVPGRPETTFQEFSAPVVSSAGNVLFAARLAGPQPASGLFLWTPRGMQIVPIPPEMQLAPGEVLMPAVARHDEAVLVPRGTSIAAVAEQFFRAVASRNFQDLRPPPDSSETFEALAARAGESPVSMLLVLMEGDRVETGVLRGNPAQPVMAKRAPGPEQPPLSRIQAQTTGPRGNTIFASTPLGQETDLALYCYCYGQVDRLTAPEDFYLITQAAQGRPILSLASDGQRTVTFIAASGLTDESVGIYVTSLP